jgi:uncharacterized RDD family membrane protein YckC
MSSVPGTSCTNHWEVIEGLQNCTRCQRPFCGDCLVTIGGAPYCAQCKHEQVRDVESGVSGLQLASRGRRFAAQFLDGLLFGIPFWIVILSIYGNLFARPAVMQSTVRWPSYGLAVLFFVYDGYMLSRYGRTVGKMAMKLKVVQPDGSPITARQGWGRAAVRAILFSWASILNYLPILFTKEKTCLHDMAAKTRVVNWS